ncbi:Glycosyl transferase family 14 protein [Dioscorea alata]|uniref:Glycosyl transferase family 14 protein n=1 Tax=Dioscorea alata TaxID=55571 RepID=A0ACB7VAW3_DIOAL|nr:Glycosyl transferase family 14 protein [Dioscorea alata]
MKPWGRYKLEEAMPAPAPPGMVAVAELFPVKRKDWAKIVVALFIFMAGAVMGMSMSAHFARYFTSEARFFLPAEMYAVNCEKDCLSVKSFVKPEAVMHSMTDEELFWRASLVPKKLEFPFNRVIKVAFMFLTRGPMPFLPLWERFLKGHQGLYSIYIHAQPGYKINVSESSPFYRRQIPSEEVSWGSISLIDAEKRLLSNALLDFSNERFVLLSESCIPVFDFPTVYKYLTESDYSFVESYDEDSPRGRGRYSRSMYPEIQLHQWRKGSEWFELNRDLAVNVVADYKYYLLFSKYCKPSCYPDEHYISTYLNMFHPAQTANRSLTWVNWSFGGPHPALYGQENITAEFIQTIRNNGTICTYNNKPSTYCYLFARKFSPSALEPLLNLSSSVMKF